MSTVITGQIIAKFHWSALAIHTERHSKTYAWMTLTWTHKCTHTHARTHTHTHTPFDSAHWNSAIAGFLSADQWQPAFFTKMTMTCQISLTMELTTTKTVKSHISLVEFSSTDVWLPEMCYFPNFSLVHCNLSWQREYQLPSMLMALRSDSTPTGHLFLVP